MQICVDNLALTTMIIFAKLGWIMMTTKHKIFFFQA